MQVENRCLFLLLLLISLTTSKLTVTRQDEGDILGDIESTRCHELEAYYYPNGCHCRYGLTFSTENFTCQPYQERAYYEFYRGRFGDFPVSTIYAVCENNSLCTFNSVKENAEFPIQKPPNIPIHVNSNCRVNFVEIIHDCMPRRVGLKLSFTSHKTDHYLYLQLQKTIPFSYLEGELFQVDVTCKADNTNGKLMFKYNGTRILTDKGSFVHVPAYDPSATSCSTENEVHTTESSHDHNAIIGVIIGIIAVIALIIVIIVIVVIYYLRKGCQRP